MRYLNIPTVTFTAINGVSYQVKDRRPISVFDTAFEIDLNANDDLDEVASRPDIYGDNAEGLAYAIVDNNIVKFVETNFDVTKIKRVAIPIVDE
jgi:hypothetical protein